MVRDFLLYIGIIYFIFATCWQVTRNVLEGGMSGKMKYKN